MGALGRFFAAILVEVLKDPAARAGLIALVKEVLSDTAAYGGNNPVAQSEFKRMWNGTFSPEAGNGGVHPGEAKDQGGASGSK
jgi:hypothetical protein